MSQINLNIYEKNHQMACISILAIEQKKSVNALQRPKFKNL
jgi:hypothetical protein